ncbi:hypothetical protein GS463_25850 [Rhodococcus hoagii]|uniref:Uncharacterized protein n=1 Tax=Rhodococcus hoagii TaxID=43767 RepID=A0AAE3BC03_RHOHA|nr:hypothetical protein [Prescottella equi]MBM4542406.1 hypothetical protein [Prescottella equi]MBM4715829.1 hypothetical protein [Prescottella equi]NKS14010.1 hypothetical protein [Prescottella equi]
MINHETEMLTVPARCPRGHELTARTTTIGVSGRPHAPTYWSCVRCIRVACWRAHYDRHTDLAERGKPIPAEVLAETAFKRPAGWFDNGRPARWTERVSFASGWGYDRDDPTLEDRQAIRDAVERAERDREAEQARRDREKANADLLALCRGGDVAVRTDLSGLAHRIGV